ncbi:hypothetical protein Tco_1197517, partial [Tanacetum coccineum]
MAPLLTRSLRHPWLRYQVERLTDEMKGTLAERIRMIYTGDEAQELFTSHAWRRLFKIRGPLLGGARRMTTWRQFILALGFHTAKEMAEDRFEACWACPSYTYIRDLVRRLCHMLISYSISGGQYLSRHAERRKSGARLFGGHFIGRLDAHFDLVSDERLIDLTDIACEPPLIDIDELVKINICVWLSDTWAWVAPILERQPIVTASAPEVVDGALDVGEGAQAVRAPVQAPQPPPVASTTRTIGHSLSRLEDKVHR